MVGDGVGLGFGEGDGVGVGVGLGVGAVSGDAETIGDGEDCEIKPVEFKTIDPRLRIAEVITNRTETIAGIEGV